MGFLRRKNRPEHDAGVVYVYDRTQGLAYYGAVCLCGWMAEVVDCPKYPDRDIEERMAAAALAHDPGADTSVGFPVDKPPG